MKMFCTCAALALLAGTALAQAPAAPPPARDAAPPTSDSRPAAADAVANVKRALRETDLPSNDIIVSTHADSLVLTGHVGSKADAARAQSTAQTAAGGVHVINEIEVQDPDQAELPAARESGADQATEVEGR